MNQFPRLPLPIVTALGVVLLLAVDTLSGLKLLHTLDATLTVMINQGWSTAWADAFFIQISERGGFSVPLMGVILIALVLKFRLDGLKLWGVFIAAIAFGDIFGNLLKDLFSQPRPCAEIFNLILQPKRPAGGSCGAVASGMPSNHALNFFLTAVFLGLTLKRWRWVCVSLGVIAVTVCVSRIYLGAHYPSQVLMGACLGIMIGWGTAVLSSKHCRFMQHISEYKKAPRASSEQGA